MTTSRSQPAKRWYPPSKILKQGKLLLCHGTLHHEGSAQKEAMGSAVIYIMPGRDYNIKKKIKMSPMDHLH
jgi:hypothetical protein